MLDFYSLLVSKPFRLFRLINIENLNNLWLYLRHRKFSRILDIIKKSEDLYRIEIPKKKIYFPLNKNCILNFKSQKNPLVTIIIPVFNNWDITRSCLISVLENSCEISYEVIIADDGSTDETRNISFHVSNVRTIVNKSNHGFLFNCNNAARYARGKYLAFLNNDTIVQPSWLKPLVNLLENDCKIGLVGSKLLYPNGRLQEAGGIVFKNASGYNYGRNDFPEYPEYNYLKEVDYISGACVLIRKSLWESIGGFDNIFAPAYYEDTDLSFEIRKRGLKVIYQPLSSVVHFEGASHGNNLNSGIKTYQRINKTKFFNKWESVLKSDHYAGPKNIFKARDRTMKKKTLLFIDNHVPFYDQDAGSRSTFQYLKLMSEMGYNIKFIGDDFKIHQPYTTTIQQIGIEVLYGRQYMQKWKNWIIDHKSNFDYIYLSRPLIAKKYIRTVKTYTSAKIFYCGHDLNYLREDRRLKLGNYVPPIEPSQWKKIELEIIRSSDISYFFSSYEVQELKKLVPSSVIRKIPIYIFEEAEFTKDTTPNFGERKGILFVGGFKHPPNLDAILWFIKEILPLVKSRIPSIELTVAGSNPPNDLIKLSGDGVIVTGKLTEKELNDQYRERRLVVVPLRYGAGVKGKVIEAMYHGVPIITTSIGAEGIDLSANALLISDDIKSFANHVIHAYTNPKIWEIASKNLINIAKHNFSKLNAHKILEYDMPPD